jgi:hypothetical protein
MFGVLRGRGRQSADGVRGRMSTGGRVWRWSPRAAVLGVVPVVALWMSALAPAQEGQCTASWTGACGEERS